MIAVVWDARVNLRRKIRTCGCCHRSRSPYCRAEWQLQVSWFGAFSPRCKRKDGLELRAETKSRRISLELGVGKREQVSAIRMLSRARVC